MKNTDPLTGMAYWTYGDKKKPCLLLVHGFTGSHEGFQYLVPDLEKDYYLVVPDLPGFGVSPLPNMPWTIKHLAEIVNDFAGSLGLERPHVVSHSMGGLVAAHMLALGKDLYSPKTIFITPVASRVGHLESRTLGAVGGALQFKVGQYVPKVVTSKRISKLATSVIMTTPDKSLQRDIHGHHLKNLDYVSSSKYFYSLHRDITKQGVYDLRDELGSYDVVIIGGEKDNVTPMKTQKMLTKALDAKLEIIPGVGHLMHYEKPLEVVALIKNHL